MQNFAKYRNKFLREEEPHAKLNRALENLYDEDSDQANQPQVKRFNGESGHFDLLKNIKKNPATDLDVVQKSGPLDSAQLISSQNQLVQNIDHLRKHATEFN